MKILLEQSTLQAITWTHDATVYWGHMMSLGFIELM